MERCVPYDSHCNALQHTVMHCNTLRRTATHLHTLQHIATPQDSRNREWRDACSLIRDTATHFATLEHIGTLSIENGATRAVWFVTQTHITSNWPFVMFWLRGFNNTKQKAPLVFSASCRTNTSKDYVISYALYLEYFELETAMPINHLFK